MAQVGKIPLGRFGVILFLSLVSPFYSSLSLSFIFEYICFVSVEEGKRGGEEKDFLSLSIQNVTMDGLPLLFT